MRECAAPQRRQDAHRVSGESKTRWETERGPDRNMVLLEDFWFIDRKGRKWSAARSSRISGASIPKPLWTIVGSPHTGDYRRASIVHDIACEEAGSRRQADKMFYDACREGGCSIWESTVPCVGVRIGAWRGSIATLDDEAIRLSEDVTMAEVQLDFRIVSEDVTAAGRGR
ncbi:MULTISPECIES: DUF1353 domain-containing protein [unclassified Sphingomonas]|nr:MULTISPECIES: DUF1353 domain-containing protein [unclassified Sphingomonas]MBN8848775.1 DUF1353 domain-containing protein [Sphingomonas sp.]OJV34361.1 MAG: hypothetical protein BGO24_11735 [Sphingomonas sp. 67-36]